MSTIAEEGRPIELKQEEPITQTLPPPPPPPPPENSHDAVVPLYSATPMETDPNALSAQNGQYRENVEEDIKGSCPSAPEPPPIVRENPPVVRETPPDATTSNISEAGRTPDTDMDNSHKTGLEMEYEAKRRKRLELNRKAAQESRRRKKIRIEELQRSVGFLTREKAELTEQNNLLRRMLASEIPRDNASAIDRITAENTALKLALYEHIQNMNKGAPQPGKPPAGQQPLIQNSAAVNGHHAPQAALLRHPVTTAVRNPLYAQQMNQQTIFPGQTHPQHTQATQMQQHVSNSMVSQGLPVHNQQGPASTTSLPASHMTGHVSNASLNNLGIMQQHPQSHVGVPMPLRQEQSTLPPPPPPPHPPVDI